MGLRENAARLKPKSSMCRTGMLAGTHPEIHAELVELVNEGGYSWSGLSRALKTEDVNISGSSLGRHFNGDCECEQ